MAWEPIHNKELGVSVRDKLNALGVSCEAQESLIQELASEISNAISKNDKGVAGGVASLDNSGKVPVAQIPSVPAEVVEVDGGEFGSDPDAIVKILLKRSEVSEEVPDPAFMTTHEVAVNVADKVLYVKDSTGDIIKLYEQALPPISRAAFVTKVGAGDLSIPDGNQFVVEGLSYVASAGATAIPDLPGWLPAGDVQVRHFPTTASAVAWAVANSRTVGVAANLTVIVPTDVSTMQIVFDRLVPAPLARITVQIATGHKLTTSVTQVSRNLNNFTITSVDAEVLLDDSFSQPELFRFINCSKTPIIATVFNLNFKTGIGAILNASNMMVNPLCGIKNAAINSDSASGTGFFVWKNSRLTCLSQIISGVERGMVCTGHERRGIWVSASSIASVNVTDFSNCGSDITDIIEHAAIFASRSSLVNADGSKFDGSVRGIRCGRAFVVARISSFVNVQNPVWQFEEGFTIVPYSTFTGCGHANWPLFCAYSNNDSNTGGGGIIYVAHSTVTNSVGLLAKAGDDTSIINMTGNVVTGQDKAIAILSSGGKLIVNLTTVAYKSGSLDISDAITLGDTAALVGRGFVVTANSRVNRVVRMFGASRAHLRNAIFSGATTDYLLSDPGCEIYTAGMTFSDVNSVAGNLSSKKNFIAPLGLLTVAKAALASTYPATSHPGCILNVSDDVGGFVPAFSDGTDWRRVTDRNVIS